MMRAAGEGDNGFHGVGICPRCTVIPIKVADEALARTDRLAQGIYFAVDSGASVVVAVVAELGYSHLWSGRSSTRGTRASSSSRPRTTSTRPITRRACSGRASGRATGSSRTPPGISTPAADWTTSGFRNRSNYTSFGTHSLFSMPNRGGTTSESTPTQGGVAALMAGYGRRAADEGRISAPLDAGEIKQVLRAASSPMAQLGGLNYPGQAGRHVQLELRLRAAERRPGPHRAARQPDPAGAGHLRAVVVRAVRSDAQLRGADRGRHQRPPRRRLRLEGAVGGRAGADRGRVRDAGHAGTSTAGARGAAGHARPRGDPARAVAAPAEALRRPAQHRAAHGHAARAGHRRARPDGRGPARDRGVPRSLAARAASRARSGSARSRSRSPTTSTATATESSSYGDANGAVHAVDGDGNPLPGWPARTSALALGLSPHAGGPRGRGAGGARPDHDAARDRQHRRRPPTRDRRRRDERPRVRLRRRRAPSRRAGRGRSAPPSAGLSVPPPDRPYTRLPSQGAFGPPALMPLPGRLAARRRHRRLGRARCTRSTPTVVPCPGLAGRRRAARRLGPEAALQARPRPQADRDADDGRPQRRRQAGGRDQEPGVRAHQRGRRSASARGSSSTRSGATATPTPGGPRVSGWPVEVPGRAGRLRHRAGLGHRGRRRRVGRRPRRRRSRRGAPAARLRVPGGDRRTATWPTPPGSARRCRPSCARRSPRGARAAARALRRALRPARARASAAGARSYRSASPRRARSPGSAAGLTYASGATDLLSLLSLLLPGQRIPIVHGIQVLDPRTGLARHPASPRRSWGCRSSARRRSPTSRATGGPTSSCPGHVERRRGRRGRRRGRRLAEVHRRLDAATPGVGDLDGDGKVEVAVTTREGYLFVWDTPGRKPRRPGGDVAPERRAHRPARALTRGRSTG